jgi:hypothetical protein
MNLDIFDARANATVARRFVQIKRRMRDCVAILIPPGMFANEYGMIGLPDLQELLFLDFCLARRAG